ESEAKAFWLAFLLSLKVMTKNGWFAARPSGTEDAYKIYCESFLGTEHRALIEKEAVKIVSAVLKNA
ncbi:hypothetical protein EWM60_16660, partial [Candidatus Erwinia dacicola]|nr:hypothetical protein [Candidatus Erwinia dacicola]